jgi:hypothetical protein
MNAPFSKNRISKYIRDGDNSSGKGIENAAPAGQKGPGWRAVKEIALGMSPTLKCKENPDGEDTIPHNPSLRR